VRTTNIRNIARRLSALEVAFQLRPAPIGQRRRAWKSGGAPRIQVRFGALRSLPQEYRGDRHIEMLRRLPDKDGQQWVEFAEVPGPAPELALQDGDHMRCLDVVFVKPHPTADQDDD